MDFWTTMRTNRYTRRKPGAPSASVQDKKPLKARHSLKTWANIQREANNAPWIRPIAEAMAKARLDLLNQDQWGKDIGWAEDIFVPTNPHPDLFDLVDGSDEIGTTADGDLLEINDPKKFELSLGEVMNFMKDRDKSELRLLPMTREEAEKQGKRWYQTTDEYIQALKDNQYIKDEAILREIANDEILRQLRADLDSGDPKYLNAIRRLLDDDEYTPGDPKDDFLRIIKSQTDHSQFDPPSKVKVALGNTFAPISSRVWFDPELDYKTGKGEAAVRGLADIGLNAGYFLGPEWLTTRAALMGGGKMLGGGLANIAARAGTRAGAGATVGAGGYLYKHGLDPVFDKTFGVGTSRAPVDLRDLGLEAAFGGLNNMLSTQLLRGGKVSDNAFKLRSDIAPENPKAVDYGDIKDMFDLMKIRKAKKTDSPDIARADEITHITGSDAADEFAGLPIKKYHDKFGTNEAIETESFPPMFVAERGSAGEPIVFVPFTNTPSSSVKSAIKEEVRTPGSRYFGAKEGKGFGDGEDNFGKGVWTKELDNGTYYQSKPTGTMEKPAKGGEMPTEGKVELPSHLADVYSTVKPKAVIFENAADNTFKKKYLDYNVDFFKGGNGKKDFSNEQLGGLALLMKDAQKRDSDAAKLFSGEPTIRNSEEFARDLATASGNPRLGEIGMRDANPAKKALLQERSRYGTKDAAGNFVEGGKKQATALKNSTKKSAERKQMKVLGKSHLDRQRDYQGYGKLNAIAGTLGRAVGTQGLVNNANIMSNFIPYGLPDWRDTFGPRAEPIKYED